MLATGSTNLLVRLREAFSGLAQCKNVKLRDAYQLTSGKVRVPFEGFPIQLILGRDGKRLHLYPEYPLNGEGKESRLSGFVIFDPESRSSRISAFCRLPPQGKLILGRQFPEQQAAFAYPDCVANRHLEIRRDGDAVVFRDLSRSGTCISPIMNEEKLNRIEKLRRIRRIYGGPIEQLPRREALELLESIDAILEEEKHRPRDARGKPGGLVRIPNKMTPIIVGDLHAQVDNLLTILSQNAFLDELESGDACLVILGDAVHSEIDGQMEEMDDSLLLMDLILRLKVRFPEQIFYLRGNHDSFSEEVAKEGIPQGLLWQKAVLDVRGKAYKKALDRFYALLPYVALSKNFIACHAAPPKTKVTKQMLVDIYRYPGLIPELINNRMYRPSKPAGYTKGDLKRFRKSLGVERDTPLLVGHTPLDRSETYWLNVGGMEDHHIIYSAAESWAGVCTIIGGELMPLKYPSEHLRSVVAQLGDAPPAPSTTMEEQHIEPAVTHA